jgi:hypothetical protein
VANACAGSVQRVKVAWACLISMHLFIAYWLTMRFVGLRLILGEKWVMTTT